MPVIQSYLPLVPYLLTKAIAVVQGIAMAFFSIEICYKTGQRILTVMPVNYALFVAVGCLTGGLFIFFQNGIGGNEAWGLTTAVAMLTTIAVVPFLPNSASDATAFTFKRLPENESYKTRIAKVRNDLTDRYRLTPRESEVLELLLMGRTRQEIADELSLSGWTVKEHVGNIYSKMEIHSYKELIMLAAGDTNR